MSEYTFLDFLVTCAEAAMFIVLLLAVVGGIGFLGNFGRH